MLPCACVIFLVACGAGSGLNRHRSFEPGGLAPLPVKIMVDEESAKLQSTVIQVNPSQAILGGSASLGSGGSVGGTAGASLGVELRGKFEAGRVFRDFASNLSSHGAEAPGDTLELRLTRFRQYLGSYRLKAEMQFSARLAGFGETVRSEYTFEWSPRELRRPGVEMDMLREMIEQSLAHWAGMFTTNSTEGGPAKPGKLIFPPPREGSFSDRDVQCAYRIFIRE